MKFLEKIIIDECEIVDNCISSEMSPPVPLSRFYFPVKKTASAVVFHPKYQTH